MEPGNVRLMESMHTPAYRAFVKRLVIARERTGLNQGEAAKALRMPQARLSRMESGQRRVDVIELAAICRLYGRSMQWFVPLR